MRERIRDLGRLQHMLEHIERAEQFMQAKTLADLENDAMLRYAVVKCLEIIGEAAYMLTLEFKESHPDTPWNVIIKMRHVLVHGYYSIQMPIVWDIVHNDFPVLRPQIEKYIKEEENTK
jgi:uncharacterized protein with HEPN domain